jgi:diguanylate cyclase (GGDEF)-like protein
MPEQTLRAIQFDHYYGLLRRIVPDLAGAAACDLEANPQWSRQEWDRGHLAAALEVLKARVHDWRPTEAWDWRTTLPTGQGLYAKTLLNVVGEPVGLLVILLEHAHDPAPQQSDISDALDTLVACIGTEYKLVTELDAMADELAERYEELNLVYDTDDQAIDIASGRESLQHLVQNCVEFLDVSMAALLLPETRLSFYEINPRRPLPDAHRLLPCLGGELLSWTDIHRSAAVINDISDPLRSKVCPAVPYKLASCPVIYGEDELAGILVIINHNLKKDFTNSDRSILEVMAKKVTKIIEASYDRLTRLMNDRSFTHRLREALESARLQGLRHCVLHIDLDRLQVVNDINGREAGDRLIKQAAVLVREQVRDKDVVARLGGGAFGVLLEDCPLAQGQRVAEHIRRAVGGIELSLGEQCYAVSVSIGMTPIDAEVTSPADILNTAEVACDTAKEKGRDSIHVFQVRDTAIMERQQEMHWIGRIQRAIREDRFELYAQVIQPFKYSEEVAHFEILLRMLGDDGEVLAPGMFMPAAEHYHLMPAIDRWVIRQSLARLRPALEGMKGQVAINLSGQSLSDDGFLEFLLAELDSSEIPASWLCFEVTESTAIANLDKVSAFISTMREQGYRFSLDDFGTGLSSYAYLKDLQVDYLKIDGCFVKAIVEDPVSEAMVAAITQVGHVMGIEIIAEFVENEAIRDCLVGLGVDYGQGYGLGRPAPLDEQLQALLSPQSRAEAR